MLCARRKWAGTLGAAGDNYNMERAGTVEQRLASGIDLAPTMLAFGGITPPAGAVQGVDLFAKKPTPRPHIFAARGFSAGGENAAWTAVAAPVPGTNDPAPSILPAALVLLSPGTKVASYPMTANMPPTLLFHATGDKTIPYSNSVAFRDQMVRTLSGGREVVYFWRLGMHLFFSGFSSLVEAKSTSSLGGFSSFEPR